MITAKKIERDVKLGEGVQIQDFVNLYGCKIGCSTRIGPFVEVQKGVEIGCNCKIMSHSFICEGVTIEDNVLIGHGVTFVNDVYPRATTPAGKPKGEDDWECVPTLVKKGASVGSGSTIMCGVTIGENAIVGAGSVVTRDVAPDTIAVGNPARLLRKIPPPEVSAGTGK